MQSYKQSIIMINLKNNLQIPEKEHILHNNNLLYNY